MDEIDLQTNYTELEKENMKLRKQNQAFETLLPLLLPAKNKPKNLQNEKNNVEQADGCSPLPDKLQVSVFTCECILMYILPAECIAVGNRSKKKWTGIRQEVNFFFAVLKFLIIR